MKIEVTFELADDNEYVDPDHDMGLTEEGYEALMSALASLGADDVEPRQA